MPAQGVGWVFVLGRHALQPVHLRLLLRVGWGTYATRAMFVGIGVGLLGRSGVEDGGVGSWLLSSSSVDNSWTTRVEVGGSHIERRLVSVPCWFLAWRLV